MRAITIIVTAILCAALWVVSRKRPPYVTTVNFDYRWYGPGSTLYTQP